MSDGLPKLVIDGRMVGPVPHGFARYVRSLAEGLAHAGRDGSFKYEPIFLAGPRTPRDSFAGFGTVQVGARFLSPLELFEIPRVLKRLGAAAYHSPSFSSLRWVPCPWIVTVHDLNHLQFGGRKEKFYYERLLKPFVRKASAVATVSEFSRQEIAKWASLNPESIEVVYNAINPAFQEKADPELVKQVTSKYGLRPKEYFFSLSNSKPHKNLAALVEGFREYRAQAAGAPWDLVLNLRPDEISDAQGLRLLGPPSDEEARALMAGAGAVVFPSLYEGFGLPPVEAACQGVPLLVSRIAPHREALMDLVQGEVLWVEPRDVSAWAKAMARAARGEVLGASYESRSKLMRRFSAAKMGGHMDHIYRRVLGIRP
jgi:glycosyltransferase involved in cell wall biosynthesis